jgi:hypothetical protein
MDRGANNRLADRWIEMHRMTVESTVMQTDRQAGEQTDIEKDGCTVGQLNRQTSIAIKQTNR